MNILELEQYNLDDAVKFHDHLNPRIWDERENMRPEVREKLLLIANDFREFLGVQDLDLQDITLSGSNAAYTYTPHSDIDLHLVVTMPPDEVYQELFKAKKYQYNQEHNIRIGGYDVELYVQDAEQPHHSQGIYSIMNDQWLAVPRRQRATIDDDGVRNKYEDLTQRIDSVIKTQDHDEIAKLISKIKNMRAAGLETQGEFGVDNLVFKMLRSQGYIKRLADARTQARDRELSLLERGRRKKSKSRTRYAWGGWWYPGFGYSDSGEAGGGGDGGGGESMREQSNPHGMSPETSMFVEQQNRDIDIITQFQKFAAKQLGIEQLPRLIIHRNKQWQTDNGSFGRYDDSEHVMHLSVSDRHIMDVLRTLAHELVHYRQDLNHELSDHSGATGSPQENEANAEAGKIMRNFADRYPEIFSESASGYIPKNKREAAMPQYATALTVDIKPGEIGRQANKLGLKTNSQGKPQLLMRSENLRESLTLEQRLRLAIENGADSDDERLGNQEPTGPESPPKFPAGTTKIDVEDLTDWYRLGMDISDLDDADPADYGKGPPQTVVVFPSDEFEQPYLKQFKRLGLKTHDIDEDRARSATQGKQDLVIFDIDDTLMHTTAKIRVIKNGKVVRELTNQEFNSYELAPGEKFDFGEFRSAAKFRQESQPIEPMVRKLKTILAYHPRAQVIMLTARADFDNKKMFLQTFSDLGIDMSRVHVHRAGNLPGNAIPAEKKAVWVRHYLDSGRYDHVRLYDDSMSNLTVFKDLAQEYPDVDFRAIYVGPGGTTQTVEEAAVEADALVDVFIRGKHRGETVSQLVARDFPNQKIPGLIKKLQAKYGVNPGAVVYGPSRTLRESAETPSAGCVLFAEDTGRWGLQRRSQHVSDSGTWACWGGGRDPGESLEQTVRRELAEESGYTGDLTLVPLHKNSRYATYVGVVPHEFEPRINNESDAWCWRAFDSWPEPLHPGLAAVRELMIEQPHSDMITDSELPELPGPQDPPPRWTAQTSTDPERGMAQAQYTDMNKGLQVGFTANQPRGMTSLPAQRNLNLGLGPVNINVGDQGRVAGGYNFALGPNSSAMLGASGKMGTGVQNLSAQYQDKSGFTAGVAQGLDSGSKPTLNVGYNKDGYNFGVRQGTQSGSEPQVYLNVNKTFEEALDEMAGFWNKHRPEQNVWEGVNRSGVDLEVTELPDEDQILITATSHGKTLGRVYFDIFDSQLVAADAEVASEYRGQGIAAIIYDYAKELGWEVVRSGRQTDAGAGFWDKHRPKQDVWEDAKSSDRIIFIGNDTAIVGQEHGKRLQLSDSDAERVQDIAQRHGAWYEGNGMDRKLTAGIIDDYKGSWDDDLLSPAIKGYPAPFLYVLFSNIKENDTVEGKIGFDPDSTIFDRILNTQPSTNYFPDRRFDAETLEKFLQAVSEGPYDFVDMSQQPATERNVTQFFKLGERLMFPDNWEEYPYRAGRVAKSVNDLRDKFLATRKRGVYVAGSDHLQAVQQLLDQPITENFADGKKPGRKGLAKRVGVNCKQSVSKLRSIAKNSSGERQRMAHWCANMKSGKSK